MNDDDQLLQYYEEEYVIKTESYSTVVNSFQTPTSLSKNNQTKQAQLPSNVTISRPDGKLPNIVKAAVNSARSETATQTLLKPGNEASRVGLQISLLWFIGTGIDFNYYFSF